MEEDLKKGEGKGETCPRILLVVGFLGRCKDRLGCRGRGGSSTNGRQGMCVWAGLDLRDFATEPGARPMSRWVVSES